MVDNNDLTNYVVTAPYATLFVRCLAMLIDMLVVIAIWVLLVPLLQQLGLAIPAFDYASMSMPEIKNALIGVSSLAAGELLTLAGLYSVLWEASKKQATLGKQIFAIKVVDYKLGKKINAFKALLRFFVKVVGIVALGAGLWFALFNPKKQSWHDKVANTVVRRYILNN
jgi:uncharacterized RDD family membrane protein YckC